MALVADNIRASGAFFLSAGERHPFLFRLLLTDAQTQGGKAQRSSASTLRVIP